MSFPREPDIANDLASAMSDMEAAPDRTAASITLEF
jgi:hypothetical protein